MEFDKIRALVNALRDRLWTVNGIRTRYLMSNQIKELESYLNVLRCGERILGAHSCRKLGNDLEKLVRHLQRLLFLLKAEHNGTLQSLCAQIEDVMQLLRIHRSMFGAAHKKIEEEEQKAQRGKRLMSVAEMAAYFWGEVTGIKDLSPDLSDRLINYYILHESGRVVSPVYLASGFRAINRAKMRSLTKHGLSADDSITPNGSSPKEGASPDRLTELLRRSAALDQRITKLKLQSLPVLSTVMKQYAEALKDALRTGLTGAKKENINQSLAAVKKTLKCFSEKIEAYIAGYQAMGGSSNGIARVSGDEDFHRFLSIKTAVLDRGIRDFSELLREAKELDRLADGTFEILQSPDPAQKALKLRLQDIDRRMNEFHAMQLGLSQKVGYWGYNKLFWLTQKVTDFRDTMQYMLQSQDFSQKMKEDLYGQKRQIFDFYDECVVFANQVIQKEPWHMQSPDFLRILETAQDLKTLVGASTDAMCAHTAAPVKEPKPLRIEYAPDPGDTTVFMDRVTETRAKVQK